MQASRLDAGPGGSHESPSSSTLLSGRARVLVFDISDLVNYMAAHPIPTGIQRVQIGLVRAALGNDDSQSRVRLAAFSASAGHWIEVPVELFGQVVALGNDSGASRVRAWRQLSSHLRRLLDKGSSISIPIGSILINLGTAWWMPNYLLAVRQLRRYRDVAYIQFVHDLVPVYARDTCIPNLTEEFIGWLRSAHASTDAFMTNSVATQRDLHRAYGDLGLDSPRTHVVTLDVAETTSPDQLREVPQSFVLFVGTIEPRKNHTFAFSAWSKLLAKRGSELTPQLVCVGRKGWLYDSVLKTLEDGGLSGKVTHLENISDGDLAALFNRALFTIYPALYEGWGMPITESLSYGKIPVVPDASPFTEAAREFGVYYAAGSMDDFVSKIEMLIDSPMQRGALERQIRTTYKPRSWNAVWSDFAHYALAAGPPASAIPTVALGKFHFLGKNQSRDLDITYACGEILRTGSGWCSPEDWGCPTIGDASFEFSLPLDWIAPIRAYVALRSVHDGRERVLFSASSGEHGHKTLLPGRTEIASLRLFPRCVKSTLRLRLYCNPRRSFGVVGLFVCEDSDHSSRIRFLEELSTHVESRALAGKSH